MGKNVEIPLLTAEDIECRISTVKATGGSILLYKDARCDMRILDSVFGIYGWQRLNELIDGQLFCTVRVQNPETKEWISKQDVGTESYTEKEKGRASDAFKRACFNIGIGRELYTAPFIWITWKGNEYNNGKPRIDLKVKSIKYNSRREIVDLVIVDKDGNIRYSMTNKPKKDIPLKKEPIDDAFDLAFQEIKEAKSGDDLASIFNRWSGLQSSKQFISALTERRQQLGIFKSNEIDAKTV